jgi:hypothetical protein
MSAKTRWYIQFLIGFKIMFWITYLFIMPHLAPYILRLVRSLGIPL